MPVEVKAGKTGALRSLHQFMQRKNRSLAVRINSDYPSLTTVRIKTPEDPNLEYTLLSLPFYLLGQLHRLVEALENK